MSWERNASPSKLNNEALGACTLTGFVISCCWFIVVQENGRLQVGLGLPTCSIPLAMSYLGKLVQVVTNKAVYHIHELGRGILRPKRIIKLL